MLAAQLASLAVILSVWHLSSGHVTLTRLRGPPVLSQGSRVDNASEDGAYDPEQDRVNALPGWAGSLPARLYSGFVTVDQDAGRQLFYAMSMSQRDPEVDPLVLWFQGGPGCSGLGSGFLGEVGPFYASGPQGQELVLNNNSWTKVATVVFLESPGFTGFSGSNHSQDHSTDDGKVTSDHVRFLLRFLQRFPALAKVPLFLAGQSYAGHYVPLLAKALLPLLHASGGGGDDRRGDGGGEDRPAILLKGFLLGNPWTAPIHDNAAAVAHWFAEGLTTADTTQGLLRECKLSGGALWRTEGDNGLSPACNTWRDTAFAEIGHVQTYGLNAPVCAPAADGRDGPPPGLVGGNPTYDACLSHKITHYLNRADVQRALHAIPADGPGKDVATPWAYCLTRKDGFVYSAASLKRCMLPVYRTLASAGLRMLVYSGDTDCVVPTAGTRAWVESLKLAVTQPWRTWTNAATGQVAGHVISYRSLTLAVVRNAGHSAPYFQPHAMLQLAGAFLDAGR